MFRQKMGEIKYQVNIVQVEFVKCNWDLPYVELSYSQDPYFNDGLRTHVAQIRIISLCLFLLKDETGANITDVNACYERMAPIKDRKQ